MPENDSRSAAARKAGGDIAGAWMRHISSRRQSGSSQSSSRSPSLSKLSVQPRVSSKECVGVMLGVDVGVLVDVRVGVEVVVVVGVSLGVAVDVIVGVAVGRAATRQLVFGVSIRRRLC